MGAKAVPTRYRTPASVHGVHNGTPQNIYYYIDFILVIGVAMILPYKNKAFDEAKPLRHIDLKLDGFVWHLKPPLSEKVIL